MAEIRVYKPGDTVSIDVDLQDENGIELVSIRFGHVVSDLAQPETTVFLQGNGGGQKKATVTLTGRVEDRILSGEYKCSHLIAKDVIGNYKTHYPRIRLRIDAPPGDFEGPELTDWRFSE